ncbi:hypothetical protein Goshw_024955 [Gossypium schwendimanii]|uniref:Uncharacterized protein n=1 Tax=Gossypium schwendimanii TaxID=34291 RepID=A0A7J9L5M1_GOSSC|nr:hypothetical protein [Gossypium schwendimanii]
MVLDFEKKVEMLKDKRDRVLLDVDVAQKKGETMYPDVNHWLMKVDDMIILELKKVKGLKDEANKKYFIILCPNVKALLKLVAMQQGKPQRWPCTRRSSKQSSLAVQQLKLKAAV